MQWSKNLAAINHFGALKYSHCKYTKPSFSAEGVLTPEKAGATTQLPNLARNCSSIIHISSNKYANNGHANLFLGTPSKSCKHVFVKCATIHTIVVSKKPAHTESAGNLLHFFPSSFTQRQNKALIHKHSVSVSAWNLTATLQLIQKLCVKSGLSLLYMNSKTVLHQRKINYALCQKKQLELSF